MIIINVEETNKVFLNNLRFTEATINKPKGCLKDESEGQYETLKSRACFLLFLNVQRSNLRLLHPCGGLKVFKKVN
jgi:hypothetical protein